MNGPCVIDTVMSHGGTTYSCSTRTRRKREPNAEDTVKVAEAYEEEDSLLVRMGITGAGVGTEVRNGSQSATESNHDSRRSIRRARGRSSLSSFLANTDNKSSLVLLILTTVLLSLVVSTAADTTWENCDPCSCKWIGGKKAAECMGKRLTKVPTHLSNDLQTIDLSQNEIAELRKYEFQEANLQNIHKLYMKNCTLQFVHRDAMRGLSILIELDMSHNNLRELPVGFFHPMLKLRKLLLNHNEIEVIEDGLFKDLPFLFKIDLKSNRIHTVGLTAFSNLPVLSDINLDINQLTNLKKASFDTLDKLNSLSIMQNPWNCSCELEEFKEFVMNRNLYMQPMCYNPPALRDKAWGELTEKFACRPMLHSLRPSSRFRSVDESETLECEFYGSPRPDIYWLFNKKPLNSYDQRYRVRAIDSYTKNGRDVFITKLMINNMKPQDKGTYTCVAANPAGKTEGNIYIERSTGGGGIFSKGSNTEGSLGVFGNIYVLIALIFIIILAALALVGAILVCCRRGSICPLVGSKKYKNNNNKSVMSERGLIQTKLNDKTQNESIIEGGSVIMEMQKSLLTEVNPVEKPPRRTEVDANGSYHDGLDDKSDLKKTLLDETAFGSHDDETQSVALSDATPRSRQTFVDDGYGTSLPPDLLAFSNRFGGGGGAGPVLAMTASTPGRGGGGSVQNFPMGGAGGDNGSMIYGQSPLASPIYGAVPSAGLYGTIGHNHQGPKQGFRTLPHQRYASSTLLPGSTRLNPSPLPPGVAPPVAGGRAFTPGPIIYQPSAFMKQQGYVTIPRKPRTPSWAPSTSSNNTTTTNLDQLMRSGGRMTPTSPTSVTSSSMALDRDYVEPVYDNLGMRTSASGHSAQNVNKSGRNYSMKDRPLPATPGQQTPAGVSYAEPLYDTNKPKKVPPLPPPKPQKKKMSVMSNGSGGNVSQLYQDEGDDGTEV